MPQQHFKALITYLVCVKHVYGRKRLDKDKEDICFFRWKIEIYFIEWTPSVIFSRVAQPRVKILPMVFTRWNKFRSFAEKKKIFCLFHAFNPFWEKLYQNPVQFFSVIPRGVPLPHSNVLQYYVKREKFKVNDVIFPSGCEACAINLGNKNMKIGFFHWCYQCKIEKCFRRYFLISYRKAWNNTLDLLGNTDDIARVKASPLFISPSISKGDTRPYFAVSRSTSYIFWSA